MQNSKINYIFAPRLEKETIWFFENSVPEPYIPSKFIFKNWNMESRSYRFYVRKRPLQSSYFGCPSNSRPSPSFPVARRSMRQRFMSNYLTIKGLDPVL